jgi:transcriptional regulator with XRE-family HTH domain
MVRWARKRAGMTQHDLARVVGIAQPTVARIERGQALPRTSTLIAILDATGLELHVDTRTPIDESDRQAIRRRLAQAVPQRTAQALGRPASNHRASPTWILRRLRRFGVPFVLIGEMAEVVHGSPATMARVIEVCPARTDVAVERLSTALEELRATPSVDEARLRTADELELETDAGRLRLAAATAAGDGFATLMRNAPRVLVDVGLLVRVAAVEDLVRDRRARGAPDDIRAAAILSAIGEEAGTRAPRRDRP